MPGEEWASHCAICLSKDHCGGLWLRPGDGGDAGHLQLCTPCFGFLSDFLRVASTRQGVVHRWPALPPRAQAPAQDRCEICCEGFGTPRFGLELLPLVSEEPVGPHLRLLRQSLVLSICGHCMDFCRDVIDEESMTRWSNRRENDGPGEGWPRIAPYSVFGFGLDEADQATAQESLRGLGHAFHLCSLSHAASHTGDPGTVYLVGADAEGNATRFVSQLPPVARAQVVIVAGNAGIADALEAIRLGAADLLAAPLSRQQLAGALDRQGDFRAVAARDSVTGLPMYRLEPRFGLPCHLLSVHSPEGERPIDTYLVLRRFLRGYDRIGMEDGEPAPVLFCSDEQVPAVLRRLGMVLGPGYEIRVRERVEAESPPPPITASSYFGRLRAKRAG